MMMSTKYGGDIMHPFLNPQVVDAFRDEKRRYWRSRAERTRTDQPDMTPPWR
jgi:hypothetical protein